MGRCYPYSQYIKKSPRNRLLFKKNGHLKIEGYSDANYVGSRDDRKFPSRYCTVCKKLNKDLFCLDGLLKKAERETKAGR